MEQHKGQGSMGLDMGRRRRANRRIVVSRQTNLGIHEGGEKKRIDQTKPEGKGDVSLNKYERRFLFMKKEKSTNVMIMMIGERRRFRFKRKLIDSRFNKGGRRLMER
jgi:hypothetical protein